MKEKYHVVIRDKSGNYLFSLDLSFTRTDTIIYNIHRRIKGDISEKTLAYLDDTCTKSKLRMYINQISSLRKVYTITIDEILRIFKDGLLKIYKQQFVNS